MTTLTIGSANVHPNAQTRMPDTITPTEPSKMSRDVPESPLHIDAVFGGTVEYPCCQDIDYKANGAD